MYPSGVIVCANHPKNSEWSNTSGGYRKLLYYWYFYVPISILFKMDSVYQGKGPIMKIDFNF